MYGTCGVFRGGVRQSQGPGASQSKIHLKKCRKSRKSKNGPQKNNAVPSESSFEEPPTFDASKVTRSYSRQGPNTERNKLSPYAVGKNKLQYFAREFRCKIDTSRIDLEPVVEHEQNNVEPGPELVSSQPAYDLAKNLEDQLLTMDYDNIKSESSSAGAKCCAPQCSTRDRGLSYHGFPKDVAMKRKWEAALGVGETIKNDKVCSRHFLPSDYFPKNENGKWRLYPHAVPSQYYIPPATSYDKKQLFAKRLHNFDRVGCIKDTIDLELDVENEQNGVEDENGKWRLYPHAVPSQYYIPPATSYEKEHLSAKRLQNFARVGCIKDTIDLELDVENEQNDVEDQVEDQLIAMDYVYIQPEPAVTNKKCCVPQCSSTCKDRRLSFHGFPKDVALRREWEAALGVAEMSQNAKVCSRHFSTSDYLPKKRKVRKLARLHPHAVPSQHCIPATSHDKEQKFAKRLQHFDREGRADIKRCKKERIDLELDVGNEQNDVEDLFEPACQAHGEISCIICKECITGVKQEVKTEDPPSPVEVEVLLDVPVEYPGYTHEMKGEYLDTHCTEMVDDYLDLESTESTDIDHTSYILPTEPQNREMAQRAKIQMGSAKKRKHITQSILNSSMVNSKSDIGEDSSLNDISDTIPLYNSDEMKHLTETSHVQKKNRGNPQIKTEVTSIHNTSSNDSTIEGLTDTSLIQKENRLNPHIKTEVVTSIDNTSSNDAMEDLTETSQVQKENMGNSQIKTELVTSIDNTSSNDCAMEDLIETSQVQKENMGNSQIKTDEVKSIENTISNTVLPSSGSAMECPTEASCLREHGTSATASSGLK